MNTESKRGNPQVDNRYKLTGLILVLVGLLLGLDQVLKTGWISFLIFPLCGLIMIITGLYLGAFGWLVAGSLVLGLGCGGYFLLSSTIHMDMAPRVVYALVFFGASWLL